jgi:hypothetical protein
MAVANEPQPDLVVNRRRQRCHGVACAQAKSRTRLSFAARPANEDPDNYRFEADVMKYLNTDPITLLKSDEFEKRPRCLEAGALHGRHQWRVLHARHEGRASPGISSDRQTAMPSATLTTSVDIDRFHSAQGQLSRADRAGDPYRAGDR